jgi:hypothetical protein
MAGTRKNQAGSQPAIDEYPVSRIIIPAFTIRKGIAIAANAALHQAQNIGYIDSFWWFATLNFVMMPPLLLLVRTPSKAAPARMQLGNPE